MFIIQQVQDAIHAPHIDWETCGGPVYINPATGGPGNDQSVASTLSVLPNVIEKSERVAIMHGLAVRQYTLIVDVYVFLIATHLQDFILVAEGTRIAIQCVIAEPRFLTLKFDTNGPSIGT